MSIVFDYKEIGRRYRELTDGWVPRLAEQPVFEHKSIILPKLGVYVFSREELLESLTQE